MTVDGVLQIFKDAIMLVFKLAGPMLLISMVVGLVIAVIQAATQVHEQTLTFVPKALTIVLFLFIMASFFISSTNDFMEEIFAMIDIVSSHTVTS